MSLDAIHFVYQNKISSNEAVKSFRKFNPTSKYVLICDGGSDYSDVAQTNQCEYIHCDFNLGYPHTVYGFRKSHILEYMRRVHAAVSLCTATHIITMEDDVRVISPIVIGESDEMLVTINGINNIIHPDVLKRVIDNDRSVGNRDNYYALGGGSIFRRSTFINHYEEFMRFIEIHFDDFQAIYPTVGWTDCMMSLLFLFAGKNHKINQFLYELNPSERNNYDGIEDRFKDRYSVLHHFKKNY